MKFGEELFRTKLLSRLSNKVPLPSCCVLSSLILTREARLGREQPVMATLALPSVTLLAFRSPRAIQLETSGDESHVKAWLESVKIQSELSLPSKRFRAVSDQRTKNESQRPREKCRKSRSSVFLCSETKRKRLLRRLIRTKQSALFCSC